MGGSAAGDGAFNSKFTFGTSADRRRARGGQGQAQRSQRNPELEKSLAAFGLAYGADGDIEVSPTKPKEKEGEHRAEGAEEGAVDGDAPVGVTVDLEDLAAAEATVAGFESGTNKSNSNIKGSFETQRTRPVLQSQGTVLPDEAEEKVLHSQPTLLESRGM